MVLSLSKLSNLPCEPCQLRKHTCNPFRGRVTTQIGSTFSLAHFDTWDPSQNVFILGSKYVVSFIDIFNQHNWLFFNAKQVRIVPTFKIFSQFVSDSYFASHNVHDFSHLFQTSYGLLQQTYFAHTSLRNIGAWKGYLKNTLRV